MLVELPVNLLTLDTAVSYVFASRAHLGAWLHAAWAGVRGCGGWIHWIVRHLRLMDVVWSRRDSSRAEFSEQYEVAVQRLLNLVILSAGFSRFVCLKCEDAIYICR